MKEIMLTNGQMTQVDDIDLMYLLNISTTWHLKIDKGGNSYVNSKKPRIYMHREIAKRMRLNIKMIIDHKDQNTLNNQRNNLREATHSQNKMNGKTYINNKIGIRGIYYRRNKYEAYISKDNKQYWIGSFINIKEAIEAREKIETELFGEFKPI